MTEDELNRIDSNNEAAVFPDKVRRKLCAEVRRLNLQLSEAERKGRDLCQAYGEALLLLRKAEWVHDSGAGGHYCPICENARATGHSEGCDLGHHLHGAFSPAKVLEDKTAIEKRVEPAPKCDHSGIEQRGTGYCCAVCKEQLNGVSDRPCEGKHTNPGMKDGKWWCYDCGTAL